MRRMLAILTTIALALTLTVPASAKPKQDPPGQAPANEGLTCAQFFGDNDPRVVAVPDHSGYGEASVVIDRHLKEACFDVPSGGTWTITLAPVAGAADPREVQLRLEDSMPGDACYQANLTTYESLSFDMGDGTCPLDGEGEWTDSDPDQQVLYLYMVGPGRSAVEVTLERSDS